jgi:hypothetical protein
MPQRPESTEGRSAGIRMYPAGSRAWVACSPRARVVLLIRPLKGFCCRALPRQIRPVQAPVKNSRTRECWHPGQRGAAFTFGHWLKIAAPLRTEQLLSWLSGVQEARSPEPGNRAQPWAHGYFICARDTRTRICHRIDAARLYHDGSNFCSAVNASLPGVRLSIPATVCRSCRVLTFRSTLALYFTTLR